MDYASEASAMSDELVSAKAGTNASGWGASLNEIERTAAGLVDANNKLAFEHRNLDNQIKAAEGAVAVQKAKNQEDVQALQQRREDIAAPRKTVIARSGLAELERTVARKRAAFSVMQTKARGLDNKIGLRKLKLSELELQKKTVLIERGAVEKSSATSLRAEVASFKEQVESQTEQERIISEKLAALQNDDKPFMGEVRTVSSEIANLKEQLAEASARERELADQLSNSQAKANSLEKDGTVTRLRSLTQQKEALASRVAGIENQIRELEKTRPDVLNPIDELKEKQASLEKQNMTIGTGIDDLRENIAVLEYKISSLERYQNRNRKRGR